MRIRAVVQRIIKELFRDKRSLALMMLAPLLILTLMNALFKSTDEQTRPFVIGMPAQTAEIIESSLPDKRVTIERIPDNGSSIDLVKKNDLDAYVRLDGSQGTVTYRNEEPGQTNQIRQLVMNSLAQERMTRLEQQAAQSNPRAPVQSQGNPKLDSVYVYGEADTTFFDTIFPLLIGFFVFFFVFLISGIALLRERTSGTLERLLMTPIRRSQLVFGYLLGYGFFAIIQTLLIIGYSLYVLKIEIAGSLILVGTTTILTALVALSIGLFISTFANTEFQILQFIPVVIVPQVFFSGLIPLDSLADWAQIVSRFFPLSYTGRALTAIMIRGEGFDQIASDLGVLMLFLLFFLGANILGMKRYRSV